VPCLSPPCHYTALPHLPHLPQLPPCTDCAYLLDVLPHLLQQSLGIAVIGVCPLLKLLLRTASDSLNPVGGHRERQGAAGGGVAIVVKSTRQSAALRPAVPASLHSPLHWPRPATHQLGRVLLRKLVADVVCHPVPPPAVVKDGAHEAHSATLAHCRGVRDDAKVNSCSMLAGTAWSARPAFQRRCAVLSASQGPRRLHQAIKALFRAPQLHRAPFGKPPGDWCVPASARALCSSVL